KGSAPVAVDPTDPNDVTDRLTITASAPGYTTYTSEPRTLAQRANETVTIPELAKGDDGTMGTLRRPGGGKSSRRKIGIIVGASGLGLMAAGTIYAYIARNNLDSYC